MSEMLSKKVFQMKILLKDLQTDYSLKLLFQIQEILAGMSLTSGIILMIQLQLS